MKGYDWLLSKGRAGGAAVTRMCGVLSDLIMDLIN